MLGLAVPTDVIVKDGGDAEQPERSVVVPQGRLPKGPDEDDVGVGVDQQVLNCDKGDRQLGQLLHEPAAHGAHFHPSQIFFPCPKRREVESPESSRQQLFRRYNVPLCSGYARL